MPIRGFIGAWLLAGVLRKFNPYTRSFIMANVTMRQMLEAGVHFGHQTRYWNPKMAPFIFGHRSKIHIINLEKTLPMLNDALNFLGSLASNNGKILFVGTKRAAREPLAKAAEACSMPYVTQRWLGGMLTNFKTVRQSVTRMKNIEAMAEDGRLTRLSKKEALGLRREAEKLSKSLGGIRDMEYLPDAIFVIDVGYENIAIKEANKLGIPVVGIVDTNNQAEGIDYVVPGNDDAIRAISLYAQAVAEAVSEGRKSIPANVAADEFIELDESGVPKAQKKKAVKKAARVTTKTKAATEKTQEPEGQAEAAAKESEGAEEQAVEKKAATKKKATTKKKAVTKKKAATKKKAVTKKKASTKKTASRSE